MFRNLLIFGAIAIATVLIIPDLANFRSHSKADIVNPEFQQFISGFTSGMISRNGTVQIILRDDYKGTLLPNEKLSEEVFEFDPEVKGQAVWRDNRTIEFQPSEPFINGKEYHAKFLLHKVLKVPDEFEVFSFSFRIIEQDFEHEAEGFRAHDKKDMRWQKLNGKFYSADQVDLENFNKAVTAIQGDRQLNISWTHEGDGKVHHYTIDSIERKEQTSYIILRAMGEKLGAKESREFKVEIPSLSDFSVISHKIEQSPEQYVSLQFSDPLKDQQDLTGLISLGSNSEVRFIIEENELRIYPAIRQSGPTRLWIDASVKNIFGFPLKKDFTQDILFEEIKPSVRFAGKGVILPDSRNLVLPFEAVNLKAVDVTILKIFENNIPQFLQVNELDGSDELSRVGRKLLKKRIPLRLSNNADYSKWNRFSLDLSKMIRTEPGAIYHVSIGFRKEYSVFDCPDSEKRDDKFEQLTEMDLLSAEELANEEQRYYQDYEYEEEYDWRERENPCHYTYYVYDDRTISRNIFASDLGIIAKSGNNGSILVAVTDLLTTEAIGNAHLEIYDFQKQLIADLTTDGNGVSLFNLKKKPFLIVASRGKEKGYLKIDDGTSLSLSQFDVSGEAIEKGIKGMIYGERGVWRPGDSLFLNFILEDKSGKLPEHHPVHFTLSNPQGQVVKKHTSTEGVNGFYNFSTKTDQEAPTGNWTATVKVGGTTFSKTIKVETIMPNRLKILLTFPSPLLTPAKTKEYANLQTNWLHGAAGRNLKADISVVLVPERTSFPKYNSYIFDDPVRQLSSEPVTIFEGRTDENGAAKIPVQLAVGENAPGMLKANFTTRVFEEGGAFSIDRFSIPYSPFSSYVGIKLPEGKRPEGILLNNQSHVIRVVTVDETGKLVTGHKLKASVYKINWRWWWQRDNEDLADFFGRKEVEPVYETEIYAANGQANFQFKPSAEDWGRYYVSVTDLESNHRAGGTIYIDWPDWQRRSRQADESGATMLSFTSDKEKYKVGESIKLNIPTAQKGKILITVENGSGILASHWVESQKNITSFEIKATKEMTPNIYFYATYIQPHSQTTNDMPIRMYGVIPVKVENEETHLKPLLSVANVLVPEVNASITVREEKGKEMAYTVAVVDEGLLDLTRFKTPDPWNTFYAREALGVRTWDLYEDVMGAYGGKLERLLQIGGDGEISKKGEAKANRFKPMVKFLGPFYLNKGEKKTHSFRMPQYVGSVRIMVIAGNKGAYGSAEKTVPVRKPLMVLATMPRVVSPQETIKVPVSVFAMEKSVKNVTVSIEANDKFSITSDSKESLSFNTTGDQLLEFELQVGRTPGLGKVKVVATSGKERAEFPIEIDVRLPNPQVSEVFEAVVEPGKKAQIPYNAVGVPGTNSGVLEVSVIPPMNLGTRLQYLIHYPYGCIEQTTSSVFPQLVLHKLIELKESEKKNISNNIKAGITRLKSFQLPGGGLSYWPGNDHTDEWGTTYAGHFLLLAEKNGYAIPSGLKESWIRFQKQRAQSWYAQDRYHTDLIQAYRLYTLALARQPELGAMNRLKELKGLSTAARWKLAGAYALAGQPEAARALIKHSPTQITSYRELSNTYGTELRDEAIILEVLNLTGEKLKAAAMAVEISRTLSSDNWLSTQETAYSLIALADYAGEGTSKGLQFDYNLNSGKTQAVQTQKPISQTKLMESDLKKGFAEVSNRTNAPLYVRMIMNGIPESGYETETKSNLGLTVRYTDLKGNSINPEKIKQGTDLVAEVTVTHPGERRKYEQLALAQLFPSGWEIHNARFFESGSNKRAPAIDYQDIRDDRVYTYFSLSPNETKIFRIQLNAAYLGSYYLPAVSCEAMYDRSIYAREKGKWIQVNNDKTLF